VVFALLLCASKKQETRTLFKQDHTHEQGWVSAEYEVIPKRETTKMMDMATIRILRALPGSFPPSSSKMPEASMYCGSCMKAKTDEKEDKRAGLRSDVGAIVVDDGRYQ